MKKSKLKIENIAPDESVIDPVSDPTPEPERGCHFCIDSQIVAESDISGFAVFITNNGFKIINGSVISYNDISNYLKTSDSSYVYYTYTGSGSFVGLSDWSIIYTDGDTVTISGEPQLFYTKEKPMSKQKGNLILQNPTDDILFNIAGVSAGHLITPTVTNCTCDPALATQVISGGSQIFELTADGEDYKLPTKITVAGIEVIEGIETVIPNKCTVFFYFESRSSITIGYIEFSDVIDNIEFSAIGTPVVVQPKENLEAYTWAELKQLSQELVAGTLTRSQLEGTYNIWISDTLNDQTKTSTINGENHAYRLVGLLHDLDVNGNTIGMTFEQVDLMANNYAMKSSMSDTDNWGDSDLITTLNNFTIASDLNAVITPARKACAANVSIGTPTYNQTSKLWIMSETEIANSQNKTIDDTLEGSSYEYYSNTWYSGDNRCKAESGKYWLRSPQSFDSNNRAFFAVINNASHGDIATSRSTSTNGVAPCFCI